MERISKLILNSKTRLHGLCNLVFFAIIFSACSNTGNREPASIVTENGRGVAIFIPFESISGVNQNKLDREVVIRLTGSSENMLGEYSMANSGVFFRPLIGLTPGSSYEVFFRERVVSRLTVPAKDTDMRVSVDAIYPSADTLPENLLKIYVKFSEPMRQGVSGRYLTMLNGKGDTLHDIFLNLDTELWDEEGRQLTIWLDPGRIKRGLQPNEKKGKPLKTGNSYTLGISPDWPDLNGSKLDRPYTKKFIASHKDTHSPDPSLWQINSPGSHSKHPLSITLNEPLDHSLLNNMIKVIGRDGEPVAGDIIIRNKERMFSFQPETEWSAGIYYLKIDSRLEDLAGNNLNRLFDRDLLMDKPAGKDEFFTKQFIID